jgi:hypothetical protein
METNFPQTAPELVFPPQLPFAWTLRGARARRLRAESAETTSSNRIVSCAHSVKDLAKRLARRETASTRQANLRPA